MRDGGVLRSRIWRCRCDVRVASFGAENGIVSGATAPPEMMKLIAWSTVQSVGVIFSTGTISR